MHPGAGSSFVTTIVYDRSSRGVCRGEVWGVCRGEVWGEVWVRFGVRFWVCVGVRCGGV